MQARGPSVEVLVDCPNCRVEGARVEIVVRGEQDGQRGDHAVSSRCRMCGATEEAGVPVRAGTRAWDEASTRAALADWAAEEGEHDVAAFLRANFGERDLGALVRKLVAGERVETSFEVVAWLFGGRGAVAGMTPDAAQAHAEARHVRTDVGAVPDRATDLHDGAADATAGEALRRGQPPPPQDRHLEDRRRAATRALCAARAADGRQHPCEDPVLAEALAALDLPAPEPADERVWRPNELRGVPDPAGTLRWMRAIALADGEADPSEVRLLQAYARAWQEPLESITVAETPWSTRLGQAWRKWRSER